MGGWTVRLVIFLKALSNLFLDHSRYFAKSNNQSNSDIFTYIVHTNGTHMHEQCTIM